MSSSTLLANSASLTWLAVLLLAGASAALAIDQDGIVRAEEEEESPERNSIREWMLALFDSDGDDPKAVRDAVAGIYSCYSSPPVQGAGRTADLRSFVANTWFKTRDCSLVGNDLFPNPVGRSYEAFSRVLMLDTTDGRTRALALLCLYLSINDGTKTKRSQLLLREKLNAIPKLRYSDALECAFDLLRNWDGSNDREDVICIVSTCADIVAIRPFPAVGEDHLTILKKLLRVALDSNTPALAEAVLRFCASTSNDCLTILDILGEELTQVSERGTVSSEFYDYQSTYNAFFAVDDQASQSTALDPRWGAAGLLATKLLA